MTKYRFLSFQMSMFSVWPIEAVPVTVFSGNSWFPVPLGLLKEYETKFPPYVKSQPLEGIPKISVAHAVEILNAVKLEKD
jgi:hypothetical protein